MDLSLKCNNIRCRRDLVGQALTTVCSHVFCLDCAESHGLVPGRLNKRPTCPACSHVFQGPQEIYVANLNPTEECKFLVLSGLDPSTIMECAGRALSFWAYQAVSQIQWNEHLNNSLVAKCQSLGHLIESNRNEAHLELSNLAAQLKASREEHSGLMAKYNDICQKYKEQSKRQLQTRELYRKVKRKAEVEQMRAAAADVVETSLENHSQSGQLEHVAPNWLNSSHKPDVVGQSYFSHLNDSVSWRRPGFADFGNGGFSARKGFENLTTTQNKPPMPFQGLAQEQFTRAQQLGAGLPAMPYLGNSGSIQTSGRSKPRTVQKEG